MVHSKLGETAPQMAVREDTRRRGGGRHPQILGTIENADDNVDLHAGILA